MKNYFTGSLIPAYPDHDSLKYSARGVLIVDKTKNKIPQKRLDFKNVIVQPK